MKLSKEDRGHYHNGFLPKPLFKPLADLGVKFQDIVWKAAADV